MQTGIARFQIDLLPGSVHDAELQVHDAVFSEIRNLLSGFCIQFNEPISWRDVEDAFILPIGPIGQSAAGQLARCVDRASAFKFGMRPQEFTRFGPESKNGAPRSPRSVED